VVWVWTGGSVSPLPYICRKCRKKGVQSPKQSIWVKKYLWNFFEKKGNISPYIKNNFWGKKGSTPPYISENVKKNFRKNYKILEKK